MYLGGMGGHSTENLGGVWAEPWIKDLCNSIPAPELLETWRTGMFLET